MPRATAAATAPELERDDLRVGSVDVSGESPSKNGATAAKASVAPPKTDETATEELAVRHRIARRVEQEVAAPPPAPPPPPPAKPKLFPRDEKKAREAAEREARAAEQAQRETERAAEQARREAEQIARESEEAAKKALEREQREIARAKEEAERTRKETERAQKEAERAQREAADRQAKEAARAQREAEAALEQAAKLAREAETAAEKKRSEEEKHEAEAARRAEKLAAKARREHEKHASKEQREAEKRATKMREEAEKAARKVAEHAAAPASPGQKPKLSRTDRRLQKQAEALNLREGETITMTAEGRSRLKRATLIVTRYRVALVSRSRRRTVRWIPLEEVNQIGTAWRGRPTITIEAAIEVLSFAQRSRHTLGPLVKVLQSEIREARAPGGRRHDPELIQEWCDRTGEVWDSSSGRFRLWIRQPPLFVVASLATLVPLAYLITRARI